jgi:hypothetical protein
MATKRLVGLLYKLLLLKAVRLPKPLQPVACFSDTGQGCCFFVFFHHGECLGIECWDFVLHLAVIS